MRLIAFCLFASAAIVPSMAVAQSTIEGRVDRIEKELKAVQRKVFPGGAGAIVQPEITPPDAVTTMPGTPASAPIVDLTARVGAIEAQLASMTGQVEQTQFRLRQLEQAFETYKAASAVNPAASTTGGGETTSGAAPAAAVQLPDMPAKAAPVAATAPSRASAGSAPAKPVSTDARRAAVAAVEIPSTGDAASDSYTYGYRLWAAKFYPEAQVQLKSTVEKYGSSAVASRAANLLGRAYLDDGKPALASVAFYENYQKRPKGDRASESLAWLGEALIQLKKPKDACRVYDELDEVYGGSLSDAQKAMAAKGRATAKCGA